MITIWKFPLKLTDRQQIAMPIGAKILTVQLQYEIPFLWAVVDTENEKEARFIEMVGTGHALSDICASRLTYIGTIQVKGGALILHVFDL